MAVPNFTNHTKNWSVSEQPWEDGNKLMLCFAVAHP